MTANLSDSPLLMDCHTHSRHSFDGKEEISALCEQAVSLGLSAYAVTDHCDLYPPRYPVEALKTAICQSVDQVAAWRDAHPTTTRILTGFELGEAVDYPDLAEEFLALRPVDLVIGSIHRTGDIVDFYYLDCTAIPREETYRLLEDYFRRQIRLVEWGKFDVLAHVTYPLRYIVGDAGIPIDLARFAPLLDELLTGVIARDLSLEVNSSGLRQKIGVPLPDETILKRYYQLGGRRISLGSDAHGLPDLGAGIAGCQQLLKKLGFTELTFYQQRQPHTLSL